MAGETIFFLPFVLARIFRPTLLEVFGLTNLELGTAFSFYGVVAMVAYLLGGPLADAFSPRKLLATALITTAAGGLAFAVIPSLSSLKLLYAYWGLTTIALFWAALMRATREWGGEMMQGAAFGLLDGGRGLLTAVTGSVLVAIYASLIPEDVASATLEQRTGAFRQIILMMVAMTCGTAVLVWFALPSPKRQGTSNSSNLNLRGVLHVFRMPTVWLQAFIIICAYVGFKATDDFSLYASDVLELDEVEAAKIGTVSLWMRPIAAIAAGYLADRASAGLMTVVSFALLAVGSLVLGCDFIQAGMGGIFLMTIICASLGIFALRGLYYAIMKEGKVPVAFTGSAVGLVSVVGYTPDIFMGPVMGYLLDRSPGPIGHQHVFLVVFGFAIAGLAGSVVFRLLTHQKQV
ncbi:MAG: putative MFS family arabinose efflux permease [Verrucomicrobiales bacterium]|jgi:predicted MFS family arabinose efflux permease